MNDAEVTIADQIGEADQEAVLSFLRDYNRSCNITFFEKRELPENAPRPLNVLARDGDGAIIGGLIGQTQFRWLKITYLAIRPDRRRKGVGRQLVELAEREAATRGCKYAVLDTMDYQAPEFYQKLGYEIAGRMADWDSHGHTKFYFVKRLGAA